MLGLHNHIELSLLKAGRKVYLKENEPISLAGNPCQEILYFPEHTVLKIEDSVQSIEAGSYLHVLEYFNHEAAKKNIFVVEPTTAVCIDKAVLQSQESQSHLLQLFFIQKLSRQATASKLLFE